MIEKENKPADVMPDCLRKSQKEINAILDDLKKQLTGIDPVDLLAKTNVAGFVLRTDFLSDFEDYRFEWKKFTDASPFLLSFYFVHAVEYGEKKISFQNLMSIIQTITDLLFNRNLENDDEEESLIGYGQTEITEILMPFRFLEVQTLCHKLDQVIFDEFSIRSDCLISDLHNFLSGIFHPKRKGGETFRYFIENFDEFYDRSNFEFVGGSKEVIKSVSGEIGGHTEVPFDTNTPLTVLDKIRKCFLNIDGRLYAFDDRLITSRFCKYLERVLNTSKDRQIFINDTKSLWSEELTRGLFEQFLPGGKYYQNNHYFLGRKDRFENDGIYIFNGIVFVIEVKAGKLSPESIYANRESVTKSYREQAEKGIQQCERTSNYISDSETSIFYNKKNEPQLSISQSTITRVISVCITFEEEKCFLPGFQMRNNNSGQITPVVINFYDLAVVFEYLSSPTLIVKYLYERSLPVFEKRLYIDDELALLGIFTKVSINLSRILNHPADQTDDNISNIYFDDSDFAHEIEMHFENNDPKPNFNIQPIFMELINEADKQIDSDLMDLLLKILGESPESLKTLYTKFRKRNNSGNFAPQSLRVIDKRGTNKEKALVLMRRSSSPFDKKRTLGYLSNRFNAHINLKVIFVAYIKGDSIDLKKYQRSDQIFSNPEIQQIGEKMSSFILEHKFD